MREARQEASEEMDTASSCQVPRIQSAQVLELGLGEIASWVPAAARWHGMCVHDMRVRPSSR